MSERTDADKLAERITAHPPEPGGSRVVADADMEMLARQLLRRREVIERLEKDLGERCDGTLDLIHANRDTILRITEDGLARVRRLLSRHGDVPDVTLALKVIEAVNSFHPMHGESWIGWPEGSA